MRSFGKAILYGIAVWAIPFIAAMFIFPLRESERPLFESIIPVAVALGAVIFSAVYLRNSDVNYVKEGIFIGVIWLGVSLIIDLSMFMWGPMKMSFIDYMKDIGLTYLMIPIITIGMGKVLDVKHKI